MSHCLTKRCFSYSNTNVYIIYTNIYRYVLPCIYTCIYMYTLELDGILFYSVWLIVSVHVFQCYWNSFLHITQSNNNIIMWLLLEVGHWSSSRMLGSFLVKLNIFWYSNYGFLVWQKWRYSYSIQTFSLV